METNMTHGEMIIARRTADRQAQALAAWAHLEADLKSLGVRPTLFGSLAKGNFMAHSDIDLTIDLQGRPPSVRIPIERMVADDLSDENVALLHAV